MIDHLVLGALELDAGIDLLERGLGVRAVYGGRHDDLGTHNALLALGSTSYLEVVAPDPEQWSEHADGPMATAFHPGMQPRLLGWAVGTGEIDSRAEKARAAGYEPGAVQAMQRRSRDGTILRWRVTRGASDPTNLPVVPFLIDWGRTPHPAQTAPTGVTLADLRAEHPEPTAVVDQLHALSVDLPVSRGDGALLIASLDGPLGRLELR